MITINIKRKAFPASGISDEHIAISDFHLALKKHEFVCLVGPSGCGKTTLLNMIAGLDKNFSGEIKFDQAQARAHFGYVFQNPRLLPWRTVRENIELALDDRDSASAIDGLLDIMQLTKFQHTYPERLSVGMSRRVAIIRAFAIDPELLLMDEPFVSLDSVSVRQVRILLLELWRQRPHTVLFVTHDLREAIELADRIVFLTTAPMRIIAEVTIPLSRTQRQQESEIEAFRSRLVKDYPELN